MSSSSSSDPAILDGLDLTEEERSVLIDNINRRLTPQAVKIRAGKNHKAAAVALVVYFILFIFCS